MCRTRIYKDRHERLGEVDVPSIDFTSCGPQRRPAEARGAGPTNMGDGRSNVHMCLGSILEFARHNLSHFPAAGHSLLSLLFTLLCVVLPDGGWSKAKP